MCGNRSSIKGKSALRYALWLYISILGVGCASTEKTPDLDAQRVQTHYTLELGAVEPQAAPLPDYFPIYVNTFAGEHRLSHRIAYRGWDFNKDGAIDMLEVLDQQGNVLKQAYDWDRDGQVDELTQ